MSVERFLFYERNPWWYKHESDRDIRSNLKISQSPPSSSVETVYDDCSTPFVVHSVFETSIVGRPF